MITDIFISECCGRIVVLCFETVSCHKARISTAKVLGLWNGWQDVVRLLILMQCDSKEPCVVCSHKFGFHVSIVFPYQAYASFRL